MPVYVMTLVAIAPILAMVATSGGALGEDASAVALVALIVSLSMLAAWLVKEGARMVADRWRREMSRLAMRSWNANGGGSSKRSTPSPSQGLIPATRMPFV